MTDSVIISDLNQKSQEVFIDEQIILDQFLHEVPEDLGILYRERKPKSLQAAMEMADATF